MVFKLSMGAIVTMYSEKYVAGEIKVIGQGLSDCYFSI